MKNITSILLALILVISMFAFTACKIGTEEPPLDPKELLSNADTFLSENPYTMTMKIDYTSDNKEMNSVFRQLNTKIPITVRGDEFSMSMTMNIDMGNVTSMMTTKMSIVDRVLYYDFAFPGTKRKMKTNLSDDQLTHFMSEQSMDMPVDYSQFSELTAEKIEDGIVITCTGITDIGKKVLNDQIAESLEAMEGSAEINDFTYSITLKDVITNQCPFPVIM